MEEEEEEEDDGDGNLRRVSMQKEERGNEE